jgi:hypothetical protein
MHRITLVMTLAAVWTHPTPVLAADLTKVDRTIKKEPAYTGKPKYCLLVFGPEANTRVWLVLDVVSKPWEPDGSKNALYVDRNGNGDLTEPGERVPCTMREQQHHASFTPKPWVTYNPHFEVGQFVVGDGLTLDVGSYVQKYRPCWLSISVNGWGKQSVGGPLLRFGDRPQDAPVIHVNGPQSLRLDMEKALLHVPSGSDPPFYEEETLVRGRTSDLYAQVGTPGLGRGTFVALSAGDVPADVHPVAEVEFPSKEAGGKPVRAKVVLDRRC